ncbi:MAG: hypothetical protein WAZ94_13460 [Phycisphaerales bacterium]
MTLSAPPSSLHTGLAAYWPINEGSGSVAYDMVGDADLTLAGTSRGGHGIDGLWGVGADGEDETHFGGLGTVPIPEAWAMLAGVGDAVTIAVVTWWGGQDATLDPLSSGSLVPPGTIVTIARVLDVEDAEDLAVKYTPVDPPPADPGDDINIYHGQGVGDGNGSDTFTEAPPFEGTAPYLILIECVRVSETEVRTRLYVADAAVQQDGTSVWAEEQGTIQIGGDDPASVVAAAVWLRTLTSGERSRLFATGGLGDLDVVVPAGDPEHPLDASGSTFLLPDYPAERAVGGPASVIATTELQRHTRRVHERSPRRYTLPFNLADAREVERLRTVLIAARGSAGVVRWRHPKDDAAGSVETAPLYRITNAGDAGIALARTAGGQFGTFTLEFEAL